MIRVYHSPHEVIVRPKSKKVELYGTDDSPVETFDLVDRQISWLENPETDCAEIILDLKVKTVN